MRQSNPISILLALSVFSGVLADKTSDELAPCSSATLPYSPINYYDFLQGNADGTDGILGKRDQGITEKDDIAKLDTEKWSTDTVKMCAEKLNNTKSASNPAGVAGCWNIPLLLKDTGVFAADLRLFRVADATDEWKDVDVSQYNISLEYDGSAAIQPRNITSKEAEATKKGMEGQTIVKLSDYQFLGKLDQSVLTKDLDDSKLKVLITPQVSITALMTGGKQLTTNISVNGSKFLNGVFSDTPSLSDSQKTAVKEAAFELPGTRIEIVPAGLYFFSAYLVVGCAIFGWGTLERAKYRDQYRKRIALQGPR